MNEDRKTDPEKFGAKNNEHVIELIDLLRIIWKWKYLIIVGTFTFALASGIISLYLEKIYSVSMVIQPGILRIKDEGEHDYIDSANNIKALIEAGTFNNPILNSLNNNMDNIPNELEFKITLPSNSNTIKIIYETGNIEQGKAIQNHLKNLLLRKYSKLVQYFQNDISMQLNLKKAEIKKIEASEIYSESNITNITKRLNELMSEIELIKKNTADLLVERNKFLSANIDKSSVLPAILYSNTIQQNLELANTLKNEINNFEIKREEEILNLKKSKNEILKITEEMKNIEFKKDSIQNIQILQSPTSSLYPIEPRITLNIILASISGLIITLFLSFLIEYILKSKRSQRFKKYNSPEK